jgi:hypothetical protein
MSKRIVTCSVRRKKAHGFLAGVLIATQWVGPVVVLCLLPWKALVVLGAICLFTWGIVPIFAVGVWALLTMLILEGCGFDL